MHNVASAPKNLMDDYSSIYSYSNNLLTYYSYYDSPLSVTCIPSPVPGPSTTSTSSQHYNFGRSRAVECTGTNGAVYTRRPSQTLASSVHGGNQRSWQAISPPTAALLLKRAVGWPGKISLAKRRNKTNKAYTALRKCGKKCLNAGQAPPYPIISPIP